MSTEDESKFSVGLRLTDLNDYITPSQSCVKPVQPTKASPGSEKRAKIELTEAGEYVEVGEDGRTTALKAATISLNDCLACSGCITSAESVLVTAQSTDQFLSLVESRVRSGGSRLFVTLSPHSVASIAAHLAVTSEAAYRKLVSLFESLAPPGLVTVADAAFAHDVSVVCVAREFVSRWRRAPEAGPLPMLASECPGWVCYAEKTHPETLPHISAAKSAMAVMGSIIRKRFGPDAVHVAVMPCFDKKLEAARDDLKESRSGARDVDTVLATTEVLEVAAKMKVDLNTIPEAEMTEERCKFANFDRSRGVLFSSASPVAQARQLQLSWGGGYLWHVLRVAAKEILGVADLSANGVNVSVVQGRNSDMREITVRAQGRAEELRFAIAFGFRNIQNVVRKLKAGNNGLHFIEVMACPQSCANGGGQLKPPRGTKPEEWIARVKSLVDSREHRNPEENAAASALLGDVDLWSDGHGGSLLVTQYHSRESKAANPMQIQW